VKLLHATATPGVYETARVNPDRDGSFDLQNTADTSTVKPCDWNDPVFTVEATLGKSAT
jgi:hypothetical protein